MAGRHKAPIRGGGPAAQFAADLRAVRAQANNPTYRKMAPNALWSHNGLSAADRGDKLPTWECTRAYLQGCGITDEEALEVWREKWQHAKRSLTHGEESL